MQKYIVLFDGRSIKHIQVYCLSPRFLLKFRYIYMYMHMKHMYFMSESETI